ncbi:MAG: chromate efflux transporter [Planctomyces sp.]|nr:chromate efflux transporter [Planctomyces sp.]
MTNPVSFKDAFAVWCRVAGQSFGGPAGQIAVMHRILVDEKKWIDETGFLHALSYCMLLPGPEAQQLATYIGWLMHRTRGGLMAGILFVLPGFVTMMVLSIIYALWQETFFITALFFGMKPAVVAIIAESLIRIARRVLRSRYSWLIAGCSFLAVFLFAIPFPFVVAAAALIGLISERFFPDWFASAQASQAESSKQAAHSSQAVPESNPRLELYAPAPTWSRALRVSAVFLTLWWLPILLLAYFAPDDSVFLKEGLFFSKTAVVTFGGAYAVLAYIAQQAVDNYRWLKPGEMLDGLGMAETTPGPLIMVVQFVGFLGAYRNPGNLDPLLAGILGACLTTWVTFVPCFYWIFLGAPFVERMRRSRTVRGMLTSISAAVAGVILNITLWFAMNTLFSQVQVPENGWFRFPVPILESLSLPALAMTTIASVIVFWYKRGIGWTLLICCALGILFLQAERFLR